MNINEKRNNKTQQETEKGTNRQIIKEKETNRYKENKQKR